MSEEGWTQELQTLLLVAAYRRPPRYDSVVVTVTPELAPPTRGHRFWTWLLFKKNDQSVCSFHGILNNATVDAAKDSDSDNGIKQIWTSPSVICASIMLSQIEAPFAQRLCILS